MGMRERGEDGECGCVNAGTVEREENQWQHVGCVGECGWGTLNAAWVSEGGHARACVCVCGVCVC